MNAIIFDQLTVANTSVGLTDASNITAAMVAKAHHALITIETADIRYRTDGTTVATTVGHLVYDGGGMEWLESKRDYGSILKGLRMKRNAGTSATASITLYD